MGICEFRMLSSILDNFPSTPPYWRTNCRGYDKHIYMILGGFPFYQSALPIRQIQVDFSLLFCHTPFAHTPFAHTPFVSYMILGGFPFYQSALPIRQIQVDFSLLFCHTPFAHTPFVS